MALHNYASAGIPLDRQARARGTSGAGSALAAVGARGTSESKGSASTFVVSGASLEATTTDVNLVALAHNDVLGNGDGNAFTLIGLGNAEGHGVIDTESVVRLGSNVNVTAKNDLNIKAGSNDVINYR